MGTYGRDIAVCDWGSALVLTSALTLSDALGSSALSIWMMCRLADFWRLRASPPCREKRRGLQGFLLLRALGLWLQMAWSDEEGRKLELYGSGVRGCSGGQQISFGGMKKSGILSGVRTLA